MFSSNEFRIMVVSIVEEEKSNIDRGIFSELEHVRCKIRGALRAGRWFSHYRGKGSTPCDRFILFRQLLGRVTVNLHDDRTWVGRLFSSYASFH